jgi:hypothetical protein
MFLKMDLEAAAKPSTEFLIALIQEKERHIKAKNVMIQEKERRIEAKNVMIQEKERIISVIKEIADVEKRALSAMLERANAELAQKLRIVEALECADPPRPDLDALRELNGQTPGNVMAQTAAQAPAEP